MNARDEYGLHPVDLALEHGKQAAAALFQAHGGCASEARKKTNRKNKKKKRGQCDRRRGSDSARTGSV